MPYELKGDFVECCDCFTVCPCWVNDLPDEDHCSGLYLWSFGPGSEINGVSVAGMHVAAATYHAVRAGGQAMFFIDTGAAGFETGQLLFDTFAGKLSGSDLEALHKLLGVYLGFRLATITSTFGRSTFSVQIDIGGQNIATAKGSHKKFDKQAFPMTLKDTALSEELGIGGRTVTVQEMDSLTVDVAALPGGPLNFRGRSGMRSKFSYINKRAPLDEPLDAQDASTED